MIKPPKLKQLGREVIVPDEDENIGQQLWSPRWECFCCHDTGLIATRLVKLVIPDYRPDRDKMPVCQRHGCGKSLRFYGVKEGGAPSDIQSSLDERIDARTCSDLDKYNRACWEEWKSQDYQKTMAAQRRIANFVNDFGGKDSEN